MTIRLLVAVAVVIVIAIPRTVTAQDRPAANLDVSYALLKDSEVSGWFVNGWKASIAGALGSWFEVVGEVGRSEQSRTGFGGLQAERAILSFVGGPRFVGRRGANVAVFGHFLLGGTRVSTRFTACGDLPPETCDQVVGAELADTHFALQPGGGVDVFFTPRVGLRLQGDYRLLVAGETFDQALHEARASAGIVFTFGRR
jgi:hypothetical protein